MMNYPIAPRKAKIVYNFGFSGRNRVKWPWCIQYDAAFSNLLVCISED